MVFAKLIQYFPGHRTWTDKEFISIRAGKVDFLQIWDRRVAFCAGQLTLDPTIYTDSALPNVQAQTKTTAIDAAGFKRRTKYFQVRSVKALPWRFLEKQIHAVLYASAAGQPKAIDAFMGHLALAGKKS